jgi:predicted AlkP superfamily pyrophosphatase or phosphodiesterase
MKIISPSCSDGDIIQSLIEKTKIKRISQIEKCLLYAPDAIGAVFYKKYQTLFADIPQHAPIKATLCSVFPPKTPVCFASMFTGAMPDIHGIKEYKKPVLECDTLFDALIRGGKKVAIIAVTNSSIDCIFRNRNLDYFSEIYDEQVTNRTIQLIEANEHDFIVAYHQEYDDMLHKSTPESEGAIEAVKNHLDSFAKFAKHCESAWEKYNRLIMFAPDHGAHIDPDTGKGIHCKDIPEDMEIYHFYNVASGKCK